MDGEAASLVDTVRREKNEGYVSFIIVPAKNRSSLHKKIKPGKIKEGDLVLKLTRPIMNDPRGKFKPN